MVKQLESTIWIGQSSILQGHIRYEVYLLQVRLEEKIKKLHEDYQNELQQIRQQCPHVFQWARIDDAKYANCCVFCGLLHDRRYNDVASSGEL